MVKKQVKGLRAVADRAVPGEVDRHQPVLDDIDPADFFDPEEFGIRQQN
jgi:hypothetical protein